MLVGRRKEQRLVDRLLERARSGNSGVLAIRAEPGMGKSALLGYAAQAQGMQVLRARGVQSEASIPFAGLFELLRPVLNFLDRIPRPQAAALEGALALRPPQAEDRFAVGAATLSLLATAAEAMPLLVLVDDAHWVDGSTSDALLFAFRRLVADRVAVILAVRSGEPSLLDGADLAHFELEGLDRAASATLLAHHAARTFSRAVIDRLYRESGGNPLALLEMAVEAQRVGYDGLLGTPLPVVTSVANVYLQRFRALPPKARDIVLLAAASDTGELSTLARAAGALGLDLADLGPAEVAGFVVLANGRLEFGHPLMRSAIYGDSSPDRRRRSHGALAGALPDVEVDRRAWHLALSTFGPDDAACAALEQAGQRARQRNAYDVSSRAFERAAQLAPDEGRCARLLYAAADSAWLSGLPSRAIEILDEVLKHGPPPELVVALDHLRGHIATRLGPVSAGQQILSLAADKAVAIDGDRAVIMLAELTNAAFYSGDVGAMRAAEARIRAIATPAGSRRCKFYGTFARGMALTFSGETEGGATLIRQALDLLEEPDELAEDPRLLAWAAQGPLWLREAYAGRALLQRAVEVARDRAAVGVLPHLLNYVAIDQATTDAWAEAEAGFHEVIGLSRETQQRTDLALALARLAWLEARKGREQHCRAHAAEAAALAGQLDFRLCQIWAIVSVGELELALGHPKEGIARFEEQQAVLVRCGIGDVDLSPAPELAELYLRVSRPQDAAAVIAAYEEKAATKGQPWALARAARSRGLIAPDDEMDSHFDTALGWHRKTPDVFEGARTELAYGSRLRRGRQRVRAREHLRSALDAFDRLGAHPWSDVARAELAATGETAHRRGPGARDQLTPQELQIALLLAHGRTTRDAASSLFLSPKTVEYHQRNVYRKLGVTSRDELTAVLAAGAHPAAVGQPTGSA